MLLNDTENKIKIIFKNIEYEINTTKLLFILSLLEDKKEVKAESKAEICTLMEKHKLFDEKFLIGMQKL